MAKKVKIGIIGCGNMGSAIAKGISRKYKVFVFDKDTGKTKNIKKARVAKSIVYLLDNADTVILAVKPQDFDAVLCEIKNNHCQPRRLTMVKKLIISIAAGIPTQYIEKILGKVKVIRVMPNLPAKIGKGMSCLSKGKFASKAELIFAKKLFDFVGKTLILKENMINAATAVSGSGPGFQFALLANKDKGVWDDFTKNFFIPALAASAEAIGFNRKQSELLARHTGEGSLMLLKESKTSPKILCNQVVSKKGTTEAGLKKLKGNIKFLPNAVKAALKRAKQLARR